MSIARHLKPPLRRRSFVCVWIYLDEQINYGINTTVLTVYSQFHMNLAKTTTITGPEFAFSCFNWNHDTTGLQLEVIGGSTKE